jgi:hypothetical protein
MMVRDRLDAQKIGVLGKPFLQSRLEIELQHY